ncbi:bifunctional DNA primase/polymerase [Streptomyces sp. 058-1L]|uniref:bifunctional DNA primase/polymerase n=1 Tax=Streptomyces sp. 058-1L TaxID=2789266 RepID=UPI003980A3C8
MSRHPQLLTTPSGASPVETALWCAGKGWPVHPLVPGRKIPPANCLRCRYQNHTPKGCSCFAAGRWCHGFHAATTDLDRIRSWWAARPAFGVAVSCGPARVVVLDVDAHTSVLPSRNRILPGIPIHPSIDLNGLENGFHTLALLAAYRGQPNPSADENTLRVQTASGGMHIWYSLPEGSHLRSSSGAGANAALAWQVDVRAEKGYVVAPFTYTKNGAYQPLMPAVEPAPLPAWLLTELARTGHVHAASADHRQAPPALSRCSEIQALTRLVETVEACATAPAGTGFSEKLNRAAYTAGGLVAAGRLSHAQAVQRLTRAAELARPMQSAKNLRTIHDGLSAGANRPLHRKGRS